MVECQHLDLIRPHYLATIEICSRDKAFCTSAPCEGTMFLILVHPIHKLKFCYLYCNLYTVNPGSIHSIKLQESSQLIKEFVPDDLIKHFCLEVWPETKSFIVCWYFVSRTLIICFCCWLNP